MNEPESESQPSHGAEALSPRGRRAAVSWFIVFTLVLQPALAAALDHFLVLRGDLPRNPTLRRLWVDYTLRVEPKRPGETLVLLVADSQGYGAEVPTAGIYAERLERLLGERMPGPVRVVNWSLYGGKAPELIVLLGAARRLEPDVTLLMAGERSFAQRFRRADDGTARTLSYFSTDVRHLLAYADVRRSLPASFRAHYVRTHELLDAWIARLVPLWRYRDLPEHLVHQIPPLRPFLDVEKPDWIARPGGERPTAFRNRRRPSVPLSRELLDETAACLAALPGRRIYARPPVRPYYEDPFFLIEAAPHFEARGIEVWNLADRISRDHFLTAAHLDLQGHGQLASMLADRLAP